MTEKTVVVLAAPSRASVAEVRGSRRSILGITQLLVSKMQLSYKLGKVSYTELQLLGDKRTDMTS
jgi:hypothetical protein